MKEMESALGHESKLNTEDVMMKMRWRWKGQMTRRDWEDQGQRNSVSDNDAKKCCRTKCLGTTTTLRVRAVTLILTPFRLSPRQVKGGSPWGEWMRIDCETQALGDLKIDNLTNVNEY